MIHYKNKQDAVQVCNALHFFDTFTAILLIFL